MQSNKMLEETVKDFEKEVDSFDVLVTFKEDIDGIYSKSNGIDEIELALYNITSYYIKETEFCDAVTLDLEIENSEDIIHNLTNSSSESIAKIVPIDTVVPSISENIINATIKLAAMKITKKESFKVNCELRSKYSEPLEEVSNKVPCEVCRKLNLEYTADNPDWMILIEELGENTGIAICRPDEIIIN